MGIIKNIQKPTLESKKKNEKKQLENISAKHLGLKTTPIHLVHDLSSSHVAAFGFGLVNAKSQGTEKP